MGPLGVHVGQREPGRGVREAGIASSTDLWARRNEHGPSRTAGWVARESGNVKIRARRESDVPQLVGLADAVRALDRWPPHRVATTRDFVAGAVPLAALVAEDDDVVVGHVAIHERSAGPVMALASEALGVGAGQLAVVARLFVDPERRDRGVGRMLLETATEAATTIARHPILDVWTELHGAIALYERAGWRRLGHVNLVFREPCGPDCLHAGGSLRSFVYSAPD
jgi:GNAT superfamily N-acetyltransferase